MRAPNVSGLVKSMGVPLTGLISPVGIRVVSIGVKVSAFTVTKWPSTSPLPWPDDVLDDKFILVRDILVRSENWRSITQDLVCHARACANPTGCALARALF